MFTFIESSEFSKMRESYLDDDEFRELQNTLSENPTIGDLIKGSGGVRKMRCSRSGMGKRGGLRVIYYFADTKGQIWLLSLYAKNKTESIPSQKADKMRKEF